MPSDERKQDTCKTSLLSGTILVKAKAENVYIYNTYLCVACTVRHAAVELPSGRKLAGGIISTKHNTTQPDCG